MSDTAGRNERIKELLEYPAGRVRVVIDSDAYNEVDDQFAIAWALRSPERMDVEAVYAAPFCSKALQKLMPLSDETIRGLAHYAGDPSEGMGKSYREILNLFALMNINSQGKVFRGSERFIGENHEPVQSAAAFDLIERAMSGGETLYVVAIGAATNVASAILLEPKIIDKIVVVWLGGQPLFHRSAAEFNLMQDIFAAQTLIESGVPLVLIPCMNVASHLTLTESELDARLTGGSVVGDYLGAIVREMFREEGIPFSDKMMKRLYLQGMDDVPNAVSEAFTAKHISWSRIIWDISAVGYLMNPNWSASVLTDAPVLTDNMTWKSKEGRHPIRVCHYVSRDHMFGDLFAKLAAEK
jgi:inosine-uridine nucleoside N-ribohydrolase